MSLYDVKLNTACKIQSLNVEDEKIKIRLMELGLIEECVVMVKKKSLLKQTLLIVFNSSCFTLKEEIAKSIVVKYA